VGTLNGSYGSILMVKNKHGSRPIGICCSDHSTEMSLGRAANFCLMVPQVKCGLLRLTRTFTILRGAVTMRKDNKIEKTSQVPQKHVWSLTRAVCQKKRDIWTVALDRFWRG